MNRLEFRKLPQLSYPVNEAFNTLSTNVSFLGQDIKKIMLTSSHVSEGKSFTSLTLSRKLAERGKRVILVDTDLRRSMIATVYGVQFAQGTKKQGLSHYLAGIAEKEEVLFNTNIPGMDFIPMGHELLNPIPLLSSERFQNLLDGLAEQYDYVIVDAAPVGVVIDAAPEVATADDHTNVNAQILHVTNLFANVFQFFGIDARAVFSCESLSGEFDDNAFIFCARIDNSFCFHNAPLRFSVF